MSNFKTKENCIKDWVNTQLSTFKGSREDVLTFIGKILFHQGDEKSEVIRLLFHAGYCYYFAKMLEDAFGGRICWVKGVSHIVWEDTREGDGCGIYYDIEGVYYDYNEGCVVPIDFLGSDFESFRHRGHDFDVVYEIEEYSTKLGISSDELKHKIYGMIPNDYKVYDYYNDGDVYRVWNKYKDKIVL